MRRFEINRVSGVFESRNTTELLLDSTAGNLLIVFRRDSGDLLDGVASALTALKTTPDGAAVSASAVSKALDHLRQALSILEGADHNGIANLVGVTINELETKPVAANVDGEG